MSEQYPGPERRTINPDHCHTCGALQLVERRVDAIEKAFPDSMEKHYDYHKAKIDAAREEAEFWKFAKLKLSEVGISAIGGVFKVVLTIALVGLLYKVGLGAIADQIPK